MSSYGGLDAVPASSAIPIPRPTAYAPAPAAFVHDPQSSNVTTSLRRASILRNEGHITDSEKVRRRAAQRNSLCCPAGSGYPSPRGM